ncbi:MAG TPA: Uma2 family endonuclease [Methanosarcinales archaeon]|nr:Uma2 family endonuclease [Methanosarcinales archaeon]
MEKKDKFEITDLISYEDFLEMCNEDTLAEWVEGKIVRYSPASIMHQNLVGWLTSVLRIYVETRGLGIIHHAPFQMKTSPDLPGREPDLIFLKKENLGLLNETYLEGPADLVIEIVSKESRLRDRYEKFAEYEIGGVKEYWILDPALKRADFFILSKEGRYLKKEDKQGIYRSQVISGFWVKVDWFWNLPQVLDALKELGLI